MKSRVLTIIFAGLALTSLGAHAASVSLVPSSANVLETSTFTVNLVLDATGLGLSEPPGPFAGKVVLDYDPLKLAYQGFAYSAPVAQWTAPLLGVAVSSRFTVSLGFQNATETSTIGVFTFKALNSLGPTSIGIAEYDDFIGTFVDKGPPDQPFYPDFNGTSVTISAVPLPATAWLFVTGFGLVGLRQRLARKARTATS